MTDLLPPIGGPPHDPTSLLCNARVGWLVAQSECAALDDGHLTLERAPGSLRWLTEGSGSFGGLRPPANVAVGPDAVWLLDRQALTLRRFDPCSCTFEAVPCFGGEGAGPRQLLDPRGIALAGNRLYVCDAGNGRVGVFVLPTLALAGHLVPGPAGPTTWLPTGIVVSSGGIVHVADPKNGMVHRFSPYGAYLGHWDGFGASSFLAIDSEGAIYAAGPLAAFRADAAGRPVPVADPADDLAGRFRPLPFVVDTAGHLHLGPSCIPPGDLAFDERGQGRPPGATAPPPDRYERVGTAVLGPLDSRLDRCVWHRVVLRGGLPAGCRIRVATYTSELALPASELDQVPEHAWATRLDCSSLHEGSWDGLVRSPAGRFLWVRLELRGDGRATPRLESIEVELPRISLRRYLPAVYGVDPESADFTDRFLALFDRELRDTEHQIDQMARLFDPLSTPALAWLAAWIGIELDRQVPENLQRSLVKRWAELVAVRGTRIGLWQLLVVFLGLDALRGTCQCVAGPGRCRPAAPTCPPTPVPRISWDPPPLILEHYQLRRWLELGAGRLGEQAVSWGRSIVNRSQLGAGATVGVTQLKATQDPWRDPFHVYAHRLSVFVPACAGRTAEQRRALERLVRRELPAHVDAHVEYVQARFRIGFQSMIGLDSVVGRVPTDGVRVGETPIGPASVLTGGATAVVDGSRIGTTAVLE